MSQHDQDKFELDIRAVKRAEADLCISKNADYGPFNIARAPGGPVNGLAVRLHDKVARLAHLLETGADPQHESVKDTFMDIANYGSIGTMVLEGLWPGVDGTSEGDIDGAAEAPYIAPAEPTAPRIVLGDRVQVGADVVGYAGRRGKVTGHGAADWDWKVRLTADDHDVNFNTYELERV